MRSQLARRRCSHCDKQERDSPNPEGTRTQRNGLQRGSFKTIFHGHDLRNRVAWQNRMLLVPALVLLVCFILIPAGAAIYISFTNDALSGVAAAHPQFVGLQNYVRLFSDDGFWNSLIVTCFFRFRLVDRRSVCARTGFGDGAESTDCVQVRFSMPPSSCPTPSPRSSPASSGYRCWRGASIRP